jgi:hypothetical protein
MPLEGCHSTGCWRTLWEFYWAGWGPLAIICVEFLFPKCSFIPCRRHKSALSWDLSLSELCTRPPSGIYLACNTVREVIACWWPLCVWCSYFCIVTRIVFPAHPSFLNFWSIHRSNLNTLVCNVRIWIKFVVRKIIVRGALSCRAEGLGFHTKNIRSPPCLKFQIKVYGWCACHRHPVVNVGTELKFRQLVVGICSYMGPLLPSYGRHEEGF